MLHRRLAFVAALALPSIIAATAAKAQNTPAKSSLVVGVIDLGVVFKKYVRKADLEKQLKADDEQREKNLQGERERIQKLRKDLDLLKPDSPAFRLKKYELLQAMKAAEIAAQQGEEELKAKMEALTLQVLDEIEAVVNTYGKNNGFDLIIKVDSKGWGDEKFQERIFRAQVSSVLFCDQKLDVTEPVLKILNDPANIAKLNGQPPK